MSTDLHRILTPWKMHVSSELNTRIATPRQSVWRPLILPEARDAITDQMLIDTRVSMSALPDRGDTLNLTKDAA